MQKIIISSNGSTPANQTDTQPMTTNLWKPAVHTKKQRNDDTRPSPRIGGRRLSDLLKMIDLSG